MIHDEKTYKNMNLSEVNVVKFLILNRYKIDNFYKVSEYFIWNNANAGNLNEELMVLLCSLDELISSVKLTNRQKEVLFLLEEGFTYTEVGKMTNRKRHTVFQVFHNLCERITKENDRIRKDRMKGCIDNV